MSFIEVQYLLNHVLYPSQACTSVTSPSKKYGTFAKRCNQSSRETARKQQIQNRSTKKVRSKRNVVCNKKVKSVKKREERLRKKKISESIRRQKIKEDPDKYEEYLANERLRKRKYDGSSTYVPVSALTNREKRYRRKGQNERQRLSRLKKKQVEENSHEEKIYVKIVSKKKRQKKKQNECYKNNNALRAEVSELNRKCDRLQKRFTRLKLKDSANVSTGSPKSAVDKFLFTKPSFEDVRRRLLFGEALSSELKLKYQSTSKNSEKQYLGGLVGGKVMKKYRLLNEAKNRIVPNLQNMKRISDTAGSMEFKKKQRSKHIFVKATVEKYFIDHSVIDPNKKAFVTIEGEQIQKRYMTASILDLHSKFCNESTFSLSYTTFTRYRPLYVVSHSVTERDTCACLTHENFKLLVHSLYESKIISQNTPEKILLHLLCAQRTDDCFTRTCSNCGLNEINFEEDENEKDEAITYYKWVTEKEERISAKTNKMISVTVTKKVIALSKQSDIKELFFNKLKAFVEHEWRIFHQYNYWKTLKASLTEKTLALVIDFSQNILGKCSVELHSMHFGASRNQFTLHTGMLYSKDLVQGFATLSESLKHDPIAIISHMIEILDYILPLLPHVENLEVISNGPTTQYRNRSMIYIMTQYLPKRYPQIKTVSYNYSEAGHGKSPADGIGASIKRSIDDEVSYGADLNDFESVLDTVKRRAKKIHVSHVTLEQIESSQSTIDLEKSKPFHGLMKTHQYTWSRDNPSEVHFNELSCTCPRGLKCDHFSIGKLNFDEVRVKKQKLDQRSLRLSEKQDYQIEIKKMKLSTMSRTSASSSKNHTEEQPLPIEFRRTSRVRTQNRKFL